jgi:hypothetical protein
MYHEYVDRNGKVTRRQYNGARLGITTSRETPEFPKSSIDNNLRSDVQSLMGNSVFYRWVRENAPITDDKLQAKLNELTTKGQ